MDFEEMKNNASDEVDDLGDKAGDAMDDTQSKVDDLSQQAGDFVDGNNPTGDDDEEDEM